MTQKISIPQNEKTFYRSYNFAKSSVNIIFQDISIVTLSNKLAYISNISGIALYRDDGLGIFQNVSKPETEKKKKTIVNFF